MGGNPFTQECELHAKVWNLYEDKATPIDDRLVKTSNNDLDTLLIIVRSILNDNVAILLFSRLVYSLLLLRPSLSKRAKVYNQTHRRLRIYFFKLCFTPKLAPQPLSTLLRLNPLYLPD
jgi:hypothetical protein